MGVYGAPPVRVRCVRVWGVRMAWDTRVSGGVHMPGHACSCVWGVDGVRAWLHALRHVGVRCGSGVTALSRVGEGGTRLYVWGHPMAIDVSVSISAGGCWL